MDDLGLTTLRQSMAYGNFEQATLTRRVQPFVDAHRGQITASAAIRSCKQ
jgi:hypothetical protein